MQQWMEREREREKERERERERERESTHIVNRGRKKAEPCEGAHTHSH